MISDGGVIKDYSRVNSNVIFVKKRRGEAVVQRLHQDIDGLECEKIDG